MPEYNAVMIRIITVIAAVILDWIFGDPYSFPHPIRYIGSLISVLDKKIRLSCDGNAKKERKGGVLLVISVIVITEAVVICCLLISYRINIVLYICLEAFWCYQLIAAGSLKKESGKVYTALKNNDTEGARSAVSMIVGRDTERLDEAGITKAAVETVAENTSDGVTAPLIYIMLFGAAGGFFYKAVNTMDSMVGYKNDVYRYFGTAAAKLDDVLNFIPSRFTALLMILAAYIVGLDGKNAFKIWKRDRLKHASPNSAQTEAVCAGALRVRLAGDAWYFGVRHEKPFIGDDLRKIEPYDICRSWRLMFGSEILLVIIFIAIGVMFI